jgi:uncharacterized protein (TIGR02145 family)
MGQLINSLFLGKVAAIKDYNGLIGDNQNPTGQADSFFNSPVSGIVDVTGYGYLYNFPVIDDVRGIADGSFRVPVVADWDDLIAVLVADASDTQANLLKSASGWKFNTDNLLNVPNETDKDNNGIDKFKFNAKPSGLRWNTGTPNSVSTGDFTSWGTIARWWCADGGASSGEKRAYYIDTSRFISDNLSFKNERHPANGYSIRFVRDLEVADAGLADGDYAADYTDTDGNVYKTVKIGNRVWCAENFYGISYLNGDPITELKTGWTNHSAPVFCVYNNAPHIVAGYKDYTKQTKELKTRETYSEWNLGTVWDIEAGINDNYPFIKTL